jgi:hypothetical protein
VIYDDSDRATNRTYEERVDLVGVDDGFLNAAWEHQGCPRSGRVLEQLGDVGKLAARAREASCPVVAVRARCSADAIAACC